MSINQHRRTVNIRMCRYYVKLSVRRSMLYIFQISINFAIIGYVLANGFAWPSVSMGDSRIIK